MSLLSQVLAISGLQSLYDPSDLTSIYQSRTGGSTGAVDSVVGIMLDKSRMGGLSAAQFIAGQPDLLGGAGSFDIATGWTLNSGATISGGALNITSAAGSRGEYSGAAFMTTTGWFVAEVVVSACSGSVSLERANAAGSWVHSEGSFSSPGTYQFVMQPRSDLSLGKIRIVQFGTSTATITDLKVKAIPGYHALAPSDAARPILRAGYVDCDGTDDWMQIFPTLNLGEQWWHVGGWKADATLKRPFGVSTTDQLRETTSADRYEWLNSSSVWTAVANGDPELAHVLTVEQTSTSALSGRYNGGGAAGPLTPIDDTAGTYGLALFSGINSSYSGGWDGRFYGGAFGTGALSSADRSLLERYVAGLSGVTLS